MKYSTLAVLGMVSILSQPASADAIYHLRIDSALSSITYHPNLPLLCQLGQTPEECAAPNQPQGPFAVAGDFLFKVQDIPDHLDNLRLENLSLTWETLPDPFHFPDFQASWDGLQVLGNADMCAWPLPNTYVLCGSIGGIDQFSGNFDGQTLIIQGYDFVGSGFTKPDFSYQFVANVVPEPSSFVLALIGLLAVAGSRAGRFRQGAES